MGRAFYHTEKDDKDLDEMIGTFLCKNPDYLPTLTESMPIVLMKAIIDERKKIDVDIGLNNKLLQRQPLRA